MLNTSRYCGLCRRVDELAPDRDSASPREADDALRLTNRGAQFAGKPRSHRGSGRLLEPGLPAKNDNAVRLTNRGAQFAGKPRSYRGSGRLLEPGLPAKNDNPVRLTNRGAQFAGKPRSYRCSAKPELAR